VIWVLTCAAVFLAAVTIDYSHARCVAALVDGRRVPAALWSVCQWMGATVGFVVAVKLSLWVLPFECLGLFVGTLLGSRPPR
jgi:hypothetical protein